MVAIKQNIYFVLEFVFRLIQKKVFTNQIPAGKII